MKTILSFLFALFIPLSTNTPAADPPAQKVRVIGIVMQKVDIGLLIECVNLGTIGAKKAQGIILLTGHPDYAKAVDGNGLKCTAQESGTYEYESVSGAGRTIRSYAFVSK